MVYRSKWEKIEDQEYFAMDAEAQAQWSDLRNITR